MTTGLADGLMPFVCLALAVGLKLLSVFWPVVTMRLAMNQRLKQVISLDGVWRQTDPESPMARLERGRREVEAETASVFLLGSTTGIFFRAMSTVFTVTGFALWLLSTSPFTRRLRHE